IQCQPPLTTFLAALGGVDLVFSQGSVVPEFDALTPLLSLLRIFGTTPENLPAQIPYLHADMGLVQSWRKDFATGEVNNQTPNSRHILKVGITWQGNPTVLGDRQRSVPLAHFRRLLQVEGIQLISLQKGPGSDQLSGSSIPGVVDLGPRLDGIA